MLILATYQRTSQNTFNLGLRGPRSRRAWIAELSADMYGLSPFFAIAEPDCMPSDATRTKTFRRHSIFVNSIVYKNDLGEDLRIPAEALSLEIMTPFHSTFPDELAMAALPGACISLIHNEDDVKLRLRQVGMSAYTDISVIGASPTLGIRGFIPAPVLVSPNSNISGLLEFARLLPRNEAEMVQFEVMLIGPDGDLRTAACSPYVTLAAQDLEFIGLTATELSAYRIQ